jgi:hypothetical protein
VSSKYLPVPDTLPSILAGKIEPSVFTFKKQTEKGKSFLTQDGLSQIQFTSVNDSHMVIELSVNNNQDSGMIFWFILDSRNINSESVERKFFYFKANEEMVLPAGRNYFERIQEVTLLSYDAEEFR